MSLGLNVATLARIEADRIYALILPEADTRETVTVPLPFFESLLKNAQNLEALAPNYIKTGLEQLTATAKVRKLRRKVVIPKQSLADVAASFRIAADLAEGRYP
jgi:proline dehydrogenase